MSRKSLARLAVTASALDTVAVERAQTHTHGGLAMRRNSLQVRGDQRARGHVALRGRRDRTG